LTQGRSPQSRPLESIIMVANERRAVDDLVMEGELDL
jgi:hypothetical protein